VSISGDQWFPFAHFTAALHALTDYGNPVAYSVPCNGLELKRKSAGTHAHDQPIGPQKAAPEANF
jgi:hypothetical protein